MSENTHLPASTAPVVRARALPGLATRSGILVSLVLLLVGFTSLIWTPGDALVAPIMRGILTSYVVAATGVAIGVFIGVPLGLSAALIGTPWSRVVGHLSSFLCVVPALAIAALMTTLNGAGAINAMVAIGIASIPGFANATHQTAGTLLSRPYVDAARLAGHGRWDAASRHAFPALTTFLAAQVVMQLGFAILAEAALSFAGLGAQPGGASLGLMLRDAQSALLFEPVEALAPGLVAVIAAAALHLIANGLRSGLEPALRAAERDDALA